MKTKPLVIAGSIVLIGVILFAVVMNTTNKTPDLDTERLVNIRTAEKILDDMTSELSGKVIQRDNLNGQIEELQTNIGSQKGSISFMWEEFRYGPIVDMPSEEMHSSAPEITGDIVPPVSTGTYMDPDGVKLTKVEFQKMIDWQTNGAGASKRFIDLKEEGVENRMREFLSKYGRGNYYPDFIKAGKRFGVKPAVVMCTAWAETDLGFALSSNFNICNVGNNDRGDREDKDDFVHGINECAYTFTNKYLGQNNILGEMSGNGRANLELPGCETSGIYCFATSKGKHGSWNANMRNCLGMIYEEPINEHFEIKQ